MTCPRPHDKEVVDMGFKPTVARETVPVTICSASTSVLGACSVRGSVPAVEYIEHGDVKQGHCLKGADKRRGDRAPGWERGSHFPKVQLSAQMTGMGHGLDVCTRHLNPLTQVVYANSEQNCYG